MKFRTPTTLMLIALLLFFQTTALPEGLATAITAAVALVGGLAIHFGTGIPSRYVTLIGAAAALVGQFGPKVLEFLPPGPGRVITILGLVLMAFNGRIQANAGGALSEEARAGQRPAGAV